jgi:HSP20 family protein
MAVMRFDPFRDFDRVTEQMFGGATRGLRAIPMEAYRRGDQFFVHLDVPGVTPDDVDLTLERNVISIRVERRSPRQEGDEVIIDERPTGVFTRQLFLGDSLDTDNMNASYERGVLTLTIPVSEKAKPRRVQIAASSETEQPQTVTAGSKSKSAQSG